MRHSQLPEVVLTCLIPFELVSSDEKVVNTQTLHHNKARTDKIPKIETM